ncbi:Ketopantoate reductase PanE/ApbA family protein [Tritrichomonas foetus]|uniref:Ketopantoate reductase PanE/ApbA family protein n=1 Tax=Tritrichomonas foetus TaxID=1144522 RepID=A0A1J4KFW5_9EUKA|nr:Ketopantoate reductase PanE/ApbA family protein [Tritrichomonas foetus]|eukprot:OHT10303.1 Ketopantoate reductase PanE/ApbA family protein [Tritrichomonas foetus]
MKVIICGAGAMGTLFGTTLINEGHDVIFLDVWQPLIYSKNKDPNATLKLDNSFKQIPINIYSIKDCPEIQADLLMMFVKSASTATCLSSLTKRNVITSNTVVFTVQGGFDIPTTISKILNNNELLVTGCTESYCKSYGPMMIENYSIEKTTVWPFKKPKDSKPLQRVIDIIEQCEKSGLKIKLTPQAITDRWKMILSYPANNAVSAVSGLAYGDVWATDEGKNLLCEIAKEVATVAKLEGVDQELFNEEIAIQFVADIAKEKSEFPGTILRDFKSKRITEIDATAGALLRKAEEKGVVLPYMKTVWSIMRLKEENYGNEYD